jgi:hypothetical protein
LTVSVTTVSVWTFFGVKVNDAPLTAKVTGTNTGSLDVTVKGPVPPEMPTTFGVSPKAANFAGLASNVDVETAVSVELEPPQPASVAQSAAAPAAIETLPKKPKEFPCVRVRAISSTSAFVKSRERVYPVGERRPSVEKRHEPTQNCSSSADERANVCLPGERDRVRAYPPAGKGTRGLRSSPAISFLAAATAPRSFDVFFL